MGELFTGLEPVKMSDQRPHRDRRDGTNTRLEQKLFDDGIVRDILTHFVRDFPDFFVEICDGIIVRSQQKPKRQRRNVFRIK